jgi:restriction system protein
VYTEDAQEFVRGLNIELIEGNRLRKMIDQARSQPKVAPLIMKESHKSIPKCPKCGEEMKKRFSRQGKHAGTEFWGCTAFPKCNGTLPSEKKLLANV